MIDIEVVIENVYVEPFDPLDDSPDAMTASFKEVDAKAALETVKVEVEQPNIACVTLELSVPDIPFFGASEDEWDTWGEDMIFPFTGLASNGDAGYFAEITKAPEEYDHAVGHTFEWGI